MFDVSHETVRSWVKDSEADEDALEIPKTIPVHITPVSAISDWKRILEETLAALPEEGETKPLFLVTGKSFEQPESIMMNIPPRKQTKT